MSDVTCRGSRPLTRLEGYVVSQELLTMPQTIGESYEIHREKFSLYWLYGA